MPSVLARSAAQHRHLDADPAVGLLLTLGSWDQMIGVMRQWASGFGTVI